MNSLTGPGGDARNAAMAARLDAVAEGLRGLVPDLEHAGRRPTAAALGAMAGLFDDLAGNVAADEAEPPPPKAAEPEQLAA